MEAAEILQALQSRVAVIPGGRDHEKRPLIIITLPAENQTWSKDQLETVLKYFHSIFSSETKHAGLTVIVDAQRSALRLVRPTVRQIESCLEAVAASIIVLRPDAFWDKQRVDNCTKSPKDGEPLYIPVSRINKFVDMSQLPEELGGSWHYNHLQWLQDRIYIETFMKDAESAICDLERLRQRLVVFKSGIRISCVEEALAVNRNMYHSTSVQGHKIFQSGKEVLHYLESYQSNQLKSRERTESETPQDITDTRERVRKLLETIHAKQSLTCEAWSNMEKYFEEAKEINLLENGVTQVTNWILGTAETLLNSRQEVGHDVMSAEELRQEHEALELQCRVTYGQYAELLHKIDMLPQCNVSLPEDLKSQRDFMDFVCRSFATRLERRRNILITSLRFFRLVTEYFERTSEVFETLVKCSHTEDFQSASSALIQLQDSQTNIAILEEEVMKQGEKLADILSMPVKDALGRDINVNYERDIANVLGLLDATAARRNLFGDSVELQKLTLRQVVHIYRYEQDATQAVKWLDDLFAVLLKEHIHVGCNVFEIQIQKDEHQAFQETAKGTYEYGCQLLNAALALRQSCKLPVDRNSTLMQNLWHSWKKLQNVGQEQMTRLRVSAVFYRSVQEHCSQLKEMIMAVKKMDLNEEISQKYSNFQKFLTTREHLLLEVGRMVRLGRLLRTRLKEPLSPEQMSADEAHCNATAVEAISDKLAEVTSLAEQLDVILCGSQEASSLGPNIKHILDGSVQTIPEEWYANIKVTSKQSSTEDSKSEDEFVTASECTCTPPSRSSSFYTASESAWWEDAEDAISDKDIPVSGGDSSSQDKDVEDKPIVKTTTEIKEGVIVHEVTETTRITLSRNDVTDVMTSFLSSETVETYSPQETKSTVVTTFTTDPTVKKESDSGTSDDSSSRVASTSSEHLQNRSDPIITQLKEVRRTGDYKHELPTESHFYYHPSLTRPALKTVL